MDQALQVILNFINFFKFIYLDEFMKNKDGVQCLNSKSKKLSMDNGGLRPDSALSIKSKRHKKSGNKLSDQEESKKTSNISNKISNSEVSTYKKLSGIDSGTNNSAVKHTPNLFNRKSNMCLVF